MRQITPAFLAKDLWNLILPLNHKSWVLSHPHTSQVDEMVYGAFDFSLQSVPSPPN